MPAEMWPIATDVARSKFCVSVCLHVGHTSELCKNSWTTQDAIRELGYVGPRNHVLDRGQDRMNPSTATRGNETTMRPFAKLLCGQIVSFLLEQLQRLQLLKNILLLGPSFIIADTRTDRFINEAVVVAQLHLTHQLFLNWRQVHVVSHHFVSLGTEHLWWIIISRYHHLRPIVSTSVT